ncbi:MATE family efflux transporter [Brevibacillus dissolubilis]|uniref:MATE family efflux transporter n=1 Tax=Brevibacillus dissolubilis TaxID=1844116 RepID=UPI002100239A|nr:MATE family efflux transporter [Brevibacillus dissolubilis]
MTQADADQAVKRMSLFALTWPIAIEFFLHMLMGTADTFMLAHISDEAVAAVGVANQLVAACLMIFAFVSQGTGVLVAQYTGARKYAESGQITAISLSMNLLFGLLISLSMVLFREDLLGMMNVKPELMEYASAYLLIVGSTLFFQALLNTAGAVVRSVGFTRDAMLVSLGMNVIHVVGNYLFIFGVMGVPQLGVTGVAISTAVSRALAFGVMLFIMYRRVNFTVEVKDYFRIQIKYVKDILKIGVPGAGENLSYQLSQLMCTTMIALLGTSALATRIYSLNIMYFVMLCGLSLGVGTQIMVGQLIGAGKIEEAYQQLMRSLRISFMVTVVCVCVMAFFARDLLGIFTSDQAIIEAGVSLLLFCIILEPGRTFNIVVIASLRAAGDAQFPVVMGILSMWGVSVPLGYFLGIHMNMGLLGFWIAFATDEWLRGILMYWRWKSRAWEKKILVRPDPVPEESAAV